MIEINVVELERRIGDGDIIMLDVREGFELEIAKVRDSLHIPMGEIKKRIKDLDKEKNYAVLCHSGYRSAQVCHFMELEGFNVVNVQGGIDSWSVYVDKGIKRY
jgi:rhodanese-related sulfurtransferase|tara:strand:- start:207 stop:518 length:312 start_codon:yes stop_codon:yes gene_type:complete